jgi:hypothetical protein
VKIVSLICAVAVTCVVARGASDLVQVREDFSADPGWEGMNNRVEATDPPTIDQNFGYSADKPGVIGGKIWRSRTIAYYALPTGKPLTFRDKFSASGTVTLMPQHKTGGAYIGFFNHERQEWRPWSSMAFRLGDYLDGAEIHVDYMSATWRAGGARLPDILPADGKPHRWRFEYEPEATIDPKWPADGLEPLFADGGRQSEDALYERAKKADPALSRKQFRGRLLQVQAQGLIGMSRMGDHDAWYKQGDPSNFRGSVTFQLDKHAPVTMYLPKEVHDDPVALDRFGIFNFQLYGRHWEFYDNESTGTNCEFYLGEVIVNDVKIDLSHEPGWEGLGNRCTFVDRDFHGRHSFGYSATNWAGDKPGEIGGTIWRNEAIDPLHAYYADEVGRLTLDDPISFSGKLLFVDGATDGDICIGYFNKSQRLAEFSGGNRDYPPDIAEKSGGRRNVHLGFDTRGGRLPGTMGVTIGGPTRIGFYFASFCAPTTQAAASTNGAVIHPDRKRRHFSFDYDPKANGGVGRIVCKLDDERFVLDLTPEMRKADASFDHFGISSMRQGGKWVTVYLDDLTYTARRPADYKPARHEQKITTLTYPPGGRRY